MPYKPFSRFILRTPATPFTDLEHILQNKESLFERVLTPEVSEAIYLASPTLYEETEKVKNHSLTSGKEKNRLVYSLSKYISRMSSRCTPFGLFAGCTTGEIGTTTYMELEESFHRRTRLDMHYLCRLYDSLVKIPEIQYNILYFSNTSLYRIGKKYRYIEYLYINNNRKYQIAEVEQSGYLDHIFQISRNGIRLPDLISSLVNEYITEEDAAVFVGELVESQLLVSELNQAITGSDYFSRILHLLESTGQQSSLCSILTEIKNLLIQIDQKKEGLNEYKEIIHLLGKIPVPYEEKYLFQVDMVKKPIKATLSSCITDEILSVMTFLNKITSFERNGLMQQFQQEFYNRYEDQEVPLTEALDPEFGIGYPARKLYGDISPLIDTLFLPAQGGNSKAELTQVETIFLKKLMESKETGSNEIILTEDDFKGFTEQWEDLPPTMCAMCEVIDADPEHPLIKFNFIGGSSGANLLSRFADTEEGIAELIREITQKEDELTREAIVAEIVHLPEARIGNIVNRPHLRKYEIVYLSNSDHPQSHTILPSDLLLSVREGKLMIRSKRLNKQIIPRLTNAHNYSYTNLPIYRFLCDMQNDFQRKILRFTWGNIENLFRSFPRVKYKNVILSVASWNIRKEDIEELLNLQEETKLIEEVTQWRKGFSLPRYILIADGDNELLIDLTNKISIQSFFNVIKSRLSVTCKEFLFNPQKAMVKNRLGVYTNELLIPFYKN
ncbi:MAG: lantibiotic dehydratase family protein [Tannerellaceae bacterium]|nr:lantibiotic dehydratase family protein [Tannerellaceae bacterium]